jgi:hypothetical protein
MHVFAPFENISTVPCVPFVVVHGVEAWTKGGGDRNRIVTRTTEDKKNAFKIEEE